MSSESRGRDRHPLSAVTLRSAAPCAVALLVVVQAADYATFLAMVGTHGLAAEANPLVAALAGHGLGLLTAAKVAAVLLVASTFLVFERHSPKVARATLGMGILVGAIGALSNFASL